MVSTWDCFHFLRYCIPRYTDDGKHVLVWSGMRLYAIDCRTASLWREDRLDDVHEIYVIGRLWCIRGEISVTLFDPEVRRDLKSYLHNEIIVASHLEAPDRVVIEDLTGKTLAVDLRTWQTAPL